MLLFKKDLTKSDIRKEISISILLSYITIGVGVLVNFFYTPFLLRHIGTNQYGVYSFVASLVSWLSIITTALCSGYLKFASQEAKKEEKSINKINGIYFWFFITIDFAVLLIGLTIGILFWLNVIPLNDFSSSEKALLVPCVFLMTVNTAISIFVSFFSLFEAYKERFIWARLITLLQTILNPLVCVPFILLGGNVVVVCVAQVVITFINLVLLSFHAIKISRMRMKLNYGVKANKALIFSIVGFSLFALLSTIATSINQSADKIILGFVSRPENVAIYQLGMSLVTYLSLFCSSVTNSLSTKLYKMDLENKESTNNLFLNISNFQIALVFLIVGGFIICGKNFMILWAGEDNVNSYYIGVILFTINIFAFTNTSSEVLVKSRGYFKFEAIYYVIEAISNVILSLSLIAIFGREHALFLCAIATFIIIFFFRWIGLSLFYKIKIKLPVGSYYLELLKYALITAGCMFITYGLSRFIQIDSLVLGFLFKGFVFSAFYLLLVLIVDIKKFKILFIYFKKRKE